MKVSGCTFCAAAPPALVIEIATDVTTPWGIIVGDSVTFNFGTAAPLNITELKKNRRYGAVALLA